MFPDALQEVPQLRHGRVPDLRPQFGDVFCHDGAEPVLACLRETRLLQLFQCPQSWVVPNMHTKAQVKAIYLSNHTVSRGLMILILLNLLPCFDFSFVRLSKPQLLVMAGNICKTEKHPKTKQYPHC